MNEIIEESVKELQSQRKELVRQLYSLDHNSMNYISATGEIKAEIYVIDAEVRNMLEMLERNK